MDQKKFDEQFDKTFENFGKNFDRVWVAGWIVTSLAGLLGLGLMVALIYFLITLAQKL